LYQSSTGEADPRKNETGFSAVSSPVREKVKIVSSPVREKVKTLGSYLDHVADS
jgi:hypothetical protein